MELGVWHIDYLHTFLRLLLAIFLGGVIGYEREKNNHPAGFRTHILVSIGSTLIMLISIYGFSEFLSEENVRFDPSRIAAQVVAGIGFLGAGTILRHGFNVTGLTTAASLWVVAAIGLAVGSGFYFGAIITTFFVLISLVVFAKLEPMIIKKKRLVEIKIVVADKPGKLGEIATKLGQRKVNIKTINITDEESIKDESFVAITLVLQITNHDTIPFLIGELKEMDGVKEAQFGKNTE